MPTQSLAELRKALFDAANQYSSLSWLFRQSPELPADASARMTAADKVAIDAELKDIEARMDALRKRLFDLQK